VATPSNSRAALAALPGRLRQARAEGHERLRHPVGQHREQQRDAEQRQKRKRGGTAILVGLDRPPASDGRQGGNGRERRRHADEHRQPAAHERAVRPREHEGQDRQDAGADDGQNAAEIGQNKQDHARTLSGYINRCDTFFTTV
jgi:Mg-chelatase subunit ChlI